MTQTSGLASRLLHPLLYTSMKGAAPITSALQHQYLILPCNYYNYYIRLAAFFQDNLGKSAPER